MRTNYLMSFCYQVIRSISEFSFPPLCASDALFQHFCSLFTKQSESKQNSETVEIDLKISLE